MSGDGIPRKPLRGTAFLQIARRGSELVVHRVTQTQPNRPAPGTRLLRLVVEMPAFAFEQMIPTATLSIDERDTIAVAVEGERPLFGEGDRVQTMYGRGTVVEDRGRYGVSIMVDGDDEPIVVESIGVELVSKRSPSETDEMIAQ